MKTISCVILFCFLPTLAFSADSIPDPTNYAIVKTAPADAAKAEIDAMRELAKAVIATKAATPEQAVNWNAILNAFLNCIVVGFPIFLALFKLLHDHHDRNDERANPPLPTDEDIANAQAVLNAARKPAFTGATATAVLILALLALSGCADRSPREPIEIITEEMPRHCPGEYQEGNQCKIIDGRKVCPLK